MNPDAPQPGNANTGSAGNAAPAASSGANQAPARKGGKLKWAVLVLVLLAAVLVVGVVMNLNTIVRRGVETQATRSLDLKTTLGAANVSLFGGSLGLEDLQIASPQGYNAPQMIALGSANVNVSLGELRQDPVRIREITLARPKIVLEAKGTKLNFQEIVANQQAKAPADPKPADSGEPIKLIIDTLTIADAQVALRPGLAIPGLKEEYALTLPSITMRNIGSGEGAQNGAAIREVVAQILTVVAAKAAESDQVPKELRDLLSLNVDAVAQRLGAEVNKHIGKMTEDLAGKLPGDLKGAATRALDGKDPGKAVEQGLKDILGGSKKDGQQKK